MTAPRPDTSLDDIRREIDSIDDAILDLVVKRFAATGRVAAAKASDGSIAVSPFRPAREASLLRRLVARGEGQLSPKFLVRLWRVILSSSTQAQAAVTIHVSPDAKDAEGFRIGLAEYFCGMNVESHRSIAETLAILNDHMGDLAVIPAAADWAQSFSELKNGTVKIIGRLPLSSGSDDALIFGHAETQATGDDESIIVTRIAEQDARLSGRRWLHVVNDWTVLALPGFLGPEDGNAAQILAADPEAYIAGRYPTPIEIRT